VSSQPPARRPNKADGSNTKVVVAILFVVLLIVILGRPIMESGLEGALDGADPVRRGPRNNAEGKKNDKEQGRPDQKIELRFPKACLRNAPVDEGLGLIAAAAGNSIRIATPDRRAVARIDGEAPVGWSATGRWLATGGGEVWTRLGNRIGLAFGKKVSKWAWSPTSDCLVAIREDRLLAWGGDARPIMKGPVLNFAFSPTGDRLAFSTGIEHEEGAGIWVGDLADGEAKLVQRYTAERTSWNLVGWSRADRPILLSTDHQPGSRNGAVLTPMPLGSVDSCGEELVVARNGRLATFGVSGPPRFLRADRFYRYKAVTCAPNREFLAAIRVPKGAPTSDTRLVLLTREGDLVRRLTQGAYRDEAPTWGPTGTGLVLARTPLGSKQQLVWFIPEGGSAYSVGVPVENGPGGIPVMDWSADAPLGHPL
jgi:hypothetical protein